MKKIDWKHTLHGALYGVAGAAAMVAVGLVIPSGAGAVEVGGEITVDAECVRGCVSDLRECVADARAEFLTCTTEGGCVELAAAARTACVADKTASICVQARAEYRDCIGPCRAALREDVKVCQNQSMTCLNEECGLTDLPDTCNRVSVSAQ